MSQKRDHFRLVFPLGQRPRLATSLADWEVIDLSENGARIAANDGGNLHSLDAFEATIEFGDGTRAAVKACIQRLEAEGAVLQFSEPLSYSVIMLEQRRLLRLYPRQQLTTTAAHCPST